MRETQLAIVGAGVAGLSAALVAAQHGLQVLVIERLGAGGQIMSVERITNMPGFAQGVSGVELAPLLQEQAEAAGAQFTLDAVQALEPHPGGAHVLRCEGEDVAARAVIVAAGSAPRPLGVPGEREFAGRGVSHCASCDGPLLRGQPVCVVGGGDAGIGEALVLAAHATSVTVVFRAASPHAQRHLLAQLEQQGNVELAPSAEVTAIIGDDSGVSGVRLRGLAGERTLPAKGVFVYAGSTPQTAFVQGVLELDAHGRILAGEQCACSVPGVFAAGDIRAGAACLLASASGDGAAAARAAWNFLRTVRR